MGTIHYDSLFEIGKTVPDIIKQIEAAVVVGDTLIINNIGTIYNEETAQLVINTLKLSYQPHLVEMNEKKRALKESGIDIKEGRPKKYTEEELLKGYEQVLLTTYDEVTYKTGISRGTLSRFKMKADQVIRDYIAGTGVEDLAVEYKIEGKTVRKILSIANIKKRLPK